MNTLSWLIYASGVVSSLSVFAGITIFVGLCVLFVANAAYHMEHDKFFPRNGRYLAGFVALGLLVSLMPSRQTILLIAASEAGEVIVGNPEAVEIFGQLKERIKRELSSDLTGGKQ